jgi:hypothetical protein
MDRRFRKLDDLPFDVVGQAIARVPAAAPAHSRALQTGADRDLATSLYHAGGVLRTLEHGIVEVVLGNPASGQTLAARRQPIQVS